MTESLAAPIIEATRRQYEQRTAEKETEGRKREAAVREQQEALAKVQASIDEQVASKLKEARVSIAADEAKRARPALSADLDQKSREVSDLQEALTQRDMKLAEAQLDLIRKQRELDDAKRELDLTLEKRVQEGLSATRDQARKEVEEAWNWNLSSDKGFPRTRSNLSPRASTMEISCNG